MISESGSELCCVEAGAFWECSSLSSICIPSSVEVLGKFCFYGCRSLSTVPFDSVSKLVYHEPPLFTICPSLSSVVMDPSLRTCLEYIDGSFRGILCFLDFVWPWFQISC
jgi:hypothetical protein